MNEDLKDGLIYEQAYRSTVESALNSLQDVPMSLLQLDEPTAYSDSRDGDHRWSLYGNSGSQTIKTTGTFGWRFTSFFGTESRHPDTAGTSKYDFGEYVGASGEFEGGYNLPNGTRQKITYKVLEMANTITLWSGLLHERDHTPASAQYYITLTMRRHYAVGSKKFHLVVFPATRMEGVLVSNGGQHKVRVYNDSRNTLIGEREQGQHGEGGVLSGLIINISDLVTPGDTVRVELIAQLALTNQNSPKEFLKGGSVCAIGFGFDAV